MENRSGMPEQLRDTTAPGAGHQPRRNGDRDGPRPWIIQRLREHLPVTPELLAARAAFFGRGRKDD